MAPGSEFIIEFFGQRTTSNVCVVSYGNIKGEFSSEEIYTRDAGTIDRFIERFDKPGRAVYFCVATIKSKKTRAKTNVAEIVCLHADLDFKGIVENRKQIEAVLAQLPLKVSRAVFSGHGIHPYWRFEAPLPPEVRERVESALRRLAWALAGDTAVCEISRVLRLPGTHNSKSNGEWIEVEVIASNDVTYTLKQLEAWLASIEQPLLTRVSDSEAEAPPIDLDPFEAYGREYARRERNDLDELWDELQYFGSGGGGNLHATEVRIGSSLLSRGEPVEDVISYIREELEKRISESRRWNWGTTKGGETWILRDQCVTWFVKNPELLDQQEYKPEWLARDSRIKKLLTEKKTEIPRYNGLFLEDIQKRRVVKREWVVENYILTRQLNGMFGDGGTGKDYILMQLGIAATCNAQWLGMDVTQGRVLYFTAEDDLDEIRRREDRITNYYTQQNTYEPRLREFKIFSLLGKDTVLGVWDSRRGLVRSTPGFELVKREVAEFKPMLTIISNRVNSFSVNQNDDAHAVQCWRILGSLCVDFGTTILMPGHASLRGMQSGDGMSGSVQWSNGCRLRTYLSRIKDEKTGLEDNPDLRVLQVMKTNYSRTGAAINMQWQNAPGGGGLFVSDMVQTKKRPLLEGETESQADQRIKDELRSEHERIFMRMLAKFASMKIRVSPSPQARNNAPLLFSNDSDCSLKGEKGKRALRDAMVRLYARGAIQSIETGPQSKRIYHIEAIGLRIVKEDNQ